MQQTPQIRTRLTLVLAAAAALMALSVMPAGANAAAWAPTVGVGDNNWPMFVDQNYRALGTRISRKVVPYDFFRHPAERADLAAWMDAAEAAGVRPLIAFNHSNVNPTKLPSVGAYRQSLVALRVAYPELRDFSTWNEANHKSQPTAHNPRRAAQYYNIARRVCRGCTIVAADVLDQKNMLPWIATFKRTARNPRLWGLHSYVDINRKVPWRRSAARRLLSAVRGSVWLTEVGGIVAFDVRYPYSESRAAAATRRTLAFARKSRRIRRVYLYCWFGVNQPHRRPYLWDSGLISAEGAPRPAYASLKRWLLHYPSALRIK